MTKGKRVALGVIEAIVLILGMLLVLPLILAILIGRFADRRDRGRLNDDVDVRWRRMRGESYAKHKLPTP